jgi:hypothetical protein
MSQNRVRCLPQLEELEQRQVLSGLTPLLSGASLTAVTTSLPGQSLRSESTTPSQVSPLIDLAPSSTTTTLLSGGAPSLSVSVLTPGTEQTASVAPQGLLNLGLQVTAAASLGGTGQATPLLNLGLSLNLAGGITPGSSGTSSGAAGTSGQVTTLISPSTLDPMASSSTDSAGAAAASTSPISVSSPMVPAAVGIPPQTGLSILTQTSALATAEEIQLAINSLGRPEQDKPQQEIDAVDAIEAAPASQLLPGRRAASPSPTSPNTGEESEAPRGGSVIPHLLAPEGLEAPEGSPWFFQLPGMFSLDKLCPKAFGPINDLTAVFLEDLRSMPRCLEQVMEWTEADGISASSWLLLGMAGLAACEVVRRQFREHSSTDALGEPAEGPALV